MTSADHASIDQASSRPPLATAWLHSLVGTFVLGLASAVGDWIWFRYLTDGALAPALGHGLLFFILLSAVLAATCPAPGRALVFLLLRLPLLGLLLAGVFYPLAYAVGYLPALLLTWIAMWLCMAWAYGGAAGRPESKGIIALRGLLAAIGSALAFWLVSDMWTQPNPDGPNVLDHLWRWSLAFFPGLLALFWRR
ncbi:MAG: hypothetical protein AAGD01_12350 [Acidobacteriota bacterium]